MCPRQVRGAHEELARDFATGEAERPLEQRHPRGFFQPVVNIQPRGEGSEFVSKPQDRSRIPDRSVDLQSIPDDPFVSQKAFPVFLTVPSDPLHRKPVVRRAEALPFLEDRQPAQPRLIDFEQEPLEEGVVARHGKSMLAVVVRTMEFVALCGVAVTRLGDPVHGFQADRRRLMNVSEFMPPTFAHRQCTYT